jgi:hypothetical protein
MIVANMTGSGRFGIIFSNISTSRQGVADVVFCFSRSFKKNLVRKISV